MIFTTRINFSGDQNKSLHHQIMRAFPSDAGKTARSNMGVLYRVDGRYVLIQSFVRPDFSRFLPDHAWQTKGHELKLPGIGQTGQFRLSINPVMRSKNGEKLVDPRYWIESRSERLGATFDVKRINEHDVHESSKGNSFRVRVTTIVGSLQVNSPDALLLAMRSGVGRSRSYGCGLLSVVFPNNLNT